MARITQKDLIIDYIHQYGSITPLQAFRDLGITKLATVVSLMRRHDGIKFKIETEKSYNRYGRPVTYAKYSLAEDEKND